MFKKLKGEIWKFRTLYNKTYFRIFAFWDKEAKEETLVLTTHGINDRFYENPVLGLKFGIISMTVVGTGHIGYVLWNKKLPTTKVKKIG